MLGMVLDLHRSKKMVLQQQKKEIIVCPKGLYCKQIPIEPHFKIKPQPLHDDE